MIDPAILATIPPSLHGEWAAGNLHRVGMLVFRKGQPGIVAHLVETGAMQKVVPSLMSVTPAGALVEGAKMAVQTYQNEQIKAAIATLQSLQLANLALTGAGIGVSILSHALLEKRIKRIEGKIDAMDEKIDRLARSIEEIKLAAIRDDFIALKTATEQAEEGWMARNKEAAWDSAAGQLHGLENKFLERARALSASGKILEIDPFVDAYSLAATVRISCRLASGDEQRARSNASDYGIELAHLLHGIGADALVEARLKARGVSSRSSEHLLALEEERPHAEKRASLYRDQEQVALSLPHTLVRIDELGLSGRDWLEAAREEEVSPLLYLSGEAGQAKSG